MKKSSKPRPRANTKMRRLEAKADQLTQEAVRVMWMNRCSWCEVYTKTGAGHHLVPRRFTATRHCLMNVCYVCTDCHNRIHGGEDKKYMGHLKHKWYPIYEWYQTNSTPDTPSDYEGLLREAIESFTTFINKNGVFI